MPANAKLHGAELGFILEHSGARVCFASDGLDATIAPHAPASLERLITIGSSQYEALFTADPRPVAPRDGDDLAWLFYTSGTTGRPKGAMLTHRVLAAASHAYAAEVDAIAPGDPVLHAAPMSHGSGLYIMPHVMRLGVNVVPESGGFEPDEIFAPVRGVAAHVHVRGADHDQAPGRQRRRLPGGQRPHHRVGRRADVCRGCAEGARPVRPAARADLRPGRKPDDDHVPCRRRRSPTATIRAGASASPRRAAPTRASR